MPLKPQAANLDTRRTALITGASSGIGAAYARLLASEGFDLVITARRKERLDSLAADLTAAHGVIVTPLAGDLSDPKTPEKLCKQLTSKKIHIDMLVNNAGFGGDKSFLDTPWAQLNGELQVMVVAVTELIHRLAPAMVENGWGRVVNVASVAGYVPVMNGLLYSGTKSYLVNVSQALDMEMRSRGVFLTALCPGLTETEFFDVQGTRKLVNSMPSLVMQSADEVALQGYKAVMAGKPVCVPGVVNKSMVAVSRLMPERLRYQVGKYNKYL